MYPEKRTVDPELAELESQLQRFRPGPSRLDRDRLMYLAGRTTVEGERGFAGAGSFGRRLWTGAFWGMTAVAASLLVALVIQSQANRLRPSPVGQQSLPALAAEQPRPEPSGHPELHKPREVSPAEAEPSRRPTVAQSPGLDARPFRFRRPDELARRLGRLDSEPASDSRPAFPNQPMAGSTAELRRQLDQFQRLTCFQYRSMLLQEWTRPPYGAEVPSANRNPSGA
ncbi:MAG: hypothetical protein GX575_08570 [Candidatus Anammoximicrobium sp.]|nr:hypothetical protein [Candidatus Anammoximicrobium sp.]